MASAFVSATTPLCSTQIQDDLKECCVVLALPPRQVPTVFVDLSDPANPVFQLSNSILNYACCPMEYQCVEVRQFNDVLKKHKATPQPPRKTRGIKRTFDGYEIYPDDDIYA